MALADLDSLGKDPIHARHDPCKAAATRVARSNSTGLNGSIIATGRPYPPGGAGSTSTGFFKKALASMTSP